jgi:hypothetical protein
MRKVVISGPPPVQVLDVTGPLEVFSNVSEYQVAVVSSDGSDQLMTSRGIQFAGAVPRDGVSGQIDTLVVAVDPAPKTVNMNPTTLTGSLMLLAGRAASPRSAPGLSCSLPPAFSMAREW